MWDNKSPIAQVLLRGGGPFLQVNFGTAELRVRLTLGDPCDDPITLVIFISELLQDDNFDIT